MAERIGMWMTVAITPEAMSSITDTNATLEKRGTHTASPATRLPTARLRHSTSSPMSPPIHSDPATRCTQSSSSERPRDGDAQDEEPDRRHHAQERHPARNEQPRCGGGLRDLRDRELRRRPGVGPDGERERSLHRVPVDGDGAPVDEVPALAQLWL